MKRRRLLLACDTSPLLVGMPAAWAQAPAAGTPLSSMRIYIPGGEGGGWDQTGRALGAAIQAVGLATQVSYENKGGKGGTLGLADFVERYNKDPHALLVGGMVMLGAIAMGKPAVTLAQVSPIARLTNDFMVLVTKTGAGPATLQDLTSQMRSNLASVAFTGGSAGGVDHMLAGMIARQLRLDAGQLKYMPTSSGSEALGLLDKGTAQVAISSYSEFQAAIESKAVTPLAISSRKAMFGVPSLEEQGIRTDLGNWRAVFAPGGITAQEKEKLRNIVVAATQSPAWAQSLKDRKWFGSLVHGKDFEQSLQIEQAIASAVTMMLKLKS
jgi:putative tricarboxylic transport membrane protein